MTSPVNGAHAFAGLQQLLPPGVHIKKYWQIFVRNVDAVFHVLHRLDGGGRHGTQGPCVSCSLGTQRSGAALGDILLRHQQHVGTGGQPWIAA